MTPEVKPGVFSLTFSVQPTCSGWMAPATLNKKIMRAANEKGVVFLHDVVQIVVLREWADLGTPLRHSRRSVP